MLDNDVINQYDGLIFDMDGTVIDTMPSHVKAWEMAEHVEFRRNPPGPSGKAKYSLVTDSEPVP